MDAGLPRLVYLRLDAIGAPSAAWLHGLPLDYRERVTRMRSERARQQTLAGLRLLSTALADGLETLARDADDRPVLIDGPAFSISHSGAYCVAVLAPEGRVGVDLERLRPLRSKRMLRLFAPAERAAAAGDPMTFCRIWTAREATIKATGRVGMRRVAQVELAADSAHIDGCRLHLQRPPLDADYTLCVACTAPLPRLAAQDLTESVRKNSAA